MVHLNMKKGNIQLCAICVSVAIFFLCAEIYIKDYSTLLHKTNILGPVGISPQSMDVGRAWRIIWPSDPQCNKFNVTFAQNTPFVYLASYPRSGNTWVRYMIEGATGIFTGSVFQSTNALKSGFIGEVLNARSGKTIIVKTHGNHSRLGKSYFGKCSDPVVLLLRNVEKSTMSYMNSQMKRKFYSRGKQGPSFYNTSFFHEQTERIRTQWMKMNEDVLTRCKDLLVVFYENIVKNPFLELRKILKFLGVTPDEDRLECLQKHIEGPAKRKHGLEDPFTKKEKSHFSSALQSIVHLLEQRKFPPPKQFYDYILQNKPNLI